MRSKTIAMGILDIFIHQNDGFVYISTSPLFYYYLTPIFTC